MSDHIGRVQPWYRGEEGDHLYVDCTLIEGEPVEGVGSIDPDGSDVCGDCRFRFQLEVARGKR